MFKKSTTFFAIVALVSAASFSHAAIVPVITPLVPPGAFVGPWAGLNGGDWESYQVGVMTDDGSLIEAVDVNVTGIFHQTWSDPEFDDMLNASPSVPANALTGDSGLTPLAGALVGSAPDEDNNGQNGAGGSSLTDTFVPGSFTGGFDHGVGSFLDGAWGIPGNDQSTSADLARIIVPAGSSSLVNYAISTNAGTLRGSFVVGIPEPTTMMLTGMGLLGFVATRRRS